MDVTAGAALGGPRRADALRNVESILEAAERCLARDPDASVSEIAVAAGLGRVTVYGHFRSRQVLVEAVAERVLARVHAELEAVDLSGDPFEALDRLVGATWTLTCRSGSLLVATERALPPDAVRAVHGGGLTERWRWLLTEGQRLGSFRRELSVDWMTATVHALVRAAVNEAETGRLDPQDAVVTIVRTLAGAFAGAGILAPTSRASNGRAAGGAAGLMGLLGVPGRRQEHGDGQARRSAPGDRGEAGGP
jgi:TetR/AcrR family transcriptional regulator, mexCD-oprJ operon repressor